jgi:hypothetical protein
MHAATSKVENSAQGSTCQLKFVHGAVMVIAVMLSAGMLSAIILSTAVLSVVILIM